MATDPRAYGENLLHPGLRASTQRYHGTMDVTLSQIQDYALIKGVLLGEPMPPGEMLSTVTAERYREEMEARADAGDRFARRVCREHEWSQDSAWMREEDESVSERSCFDHTEHPPHIWTRLTRDGPETYTCPGIGI